MDDSDRTYTVQAVTDHTRSTRDILLELYANPDVISAEPNYITKMPSAAHSGMLTGRSMPSASGTKAEPAAASGNIYPFTDPIGIGAGDLTPMQWALAGTDDIYTTPMSPTGGYQLGVPGWVEGRNDSSAPANASGTVCIMDSGLDENHPDLKGVLYEFTEEQQQKYGCLPHGFDASGSAAPSIRDCDSDGHGTHVAGIVAAQWDESGTSGVANGIKIFSVRVFSDSGSDNRKQLEGFRFLIDVAKEVNLKAVNCSWGDTTARFTLTSLVNELGRKGVITVFASGNRALDLDASLDTGGQIDSVFSVTVNGVNVNGKNSDYSCYGQNSTDVYGPGSGIMSTVPATVIQKNEEEVSGVCDFRRMYPEASGTASLLYGTDRFDGASGVRFFDVNPALHDDYAEIGSIDTSNGFDDKYAMAVDVSGLKKTDSCMGSSDKPINGSLYMAVPVDAVQDVKYVSIKTAMNDGFHPYIAMASLTCMNSEGKPVEVDLAASEAVRSGYNISPRYKVYRSQWAPLTYNVDGNISSSNAVHNMTQEERSNLRLPEEYNDPGEITGVYGWTDGGQTYVIAEIGLGDADPNGPKLLDSTRLLIDNVAIGNADAFTGGENGAYMLMSGTSMAAPAVTGCLAVIAKDEPASADLTDEELEQEALERVSRLLASVEYDDDLTALCRTGGRIVLNNQTEFTKKAPLIDRVKAAEGILTLDGYFFGKSGVLEIDGTVTETSEWTDNRISADVSGLSNGPHVAKIINPDDRQMQVCFSSSVPGNAGKALFEKELKTPMRNENLMSDHTDMFSESMVVLDGYLYVKGIFPPNDATSIWRYDLTNDIWESCVSYPEGISISIDLGNFVNYNGKIYTTMLSRDSAHPFRNIICLDPASMQWETIPVDTFSGVGHLVMCGSKMVLFKNAFGFWYDEDPEKETADSPKYLFAVIDPDKGTVNRIRCDFEFIIDENMIVTASDNNVYICGTGEDRDGELSALLYRFTIDEANQTAEADDLSHLLKNEISVNEPN